MNFQSRPAHPRAASTVFPAPLAASGASADQGVVRQNAVRCPAQFQEPVHGSLSATVATERQGAHQALLVLRLPAEQKKVESLTLTEPQAVALRAHPVVPPEVLQDVVPAQPQAVQPATAGESVWLLAVSSQVPGQPASLRSAKQPLACRQSPEPRV